LANCELNYLAVADRIKPFDRRHRNGRYWPIASFRGAAEFGRYLGIADSGEPSARQIYGFTA
jgi:hypothetical protein